MDQNEFKHVVKEILESPNHASVEKKTMFIERVLNEGEISSEQLGLALRRILFVNFRLEICETVARVISDWDSNKDDLRKSVKSWEWKDLRETIDRARDLEYEGDAKNERNATMSALLSMKKDASNDDLLTKSVEEKADDADVVDFKEATIDSSKLSKLLSTSSLNDPEWKRADGSVVERVTEKGFNCATFTHYDIKKNIALVEIVVERDTAHDQFNTIYEGDTFEGRVILNILNDFKVKDAMTIKLLCNEYGHWISGAGRHKRTHTRRNTPFSAEIVAEGDKNKRYLKGDIISYAFSIKDIIDAPSFYYQYGLSICSVKWQFSIFMDIDYGNIVKNTFGSNVDAKFDLINVGRKLSVSDKQNAHLGVPTVKELHAKVPSFMCCFSSGVIEGKIYLERDTYSLVDDVRSKQCLKSIVQMQLSNTSRHDIQFARYEFHRMISIADQLISDAVVAFGTFPDTLLPAKMLDSRNFNLDLTLMAGKVLDFASPSSPSSNYASITWKLNIVFKTPMLGIDPVCSLPIHLVSAFIP